MKNTHFIWHGSEHLVYKKHNKSSFVRKSPLKEDITYEIAHKSQRKFEKCFWDFIPKTRVIKDMNWYIILQKEVKGQILKELESHNISLEILEQIEQILEKVKRLSEEGIHVDYMGYQEKLETTKTLRYKDNSIQHIIQKSVFIIRVIYALKNMFDSTNLMIDSEYKDLYMIDSVNKKILHPLKKSRTWKILYSWMIFIHQFQIQIRKISLKTKNLFQALTK